MTEVFQVKLKGICNGRVFEETKEALNIILERGEAVPGVEEALKEMKVGEKKKIHLPPEKAFGLRTSEKIALLGMGDFTKRKIRPELGMVVNVNGMIGKVRTISGGRITVDFNHPLAGKEVDYEIELIKKLEGEERIKAISDKVMENLGLIIKNDPNAFKNYDVEKGKINIKEQMDNRMKNLTKKIFAEFDKGIAVEFAEEPKAAKDETKNQKKGEESQK